MSNRLKEQGFNNEAKIRHDDFGNYIDHNGVRTYTLTRAVNHGDSTTVGSSTAPRGSIIHTTHPTGRDLVFKAGASTVQEFGSDTGDVGAVAASAYIEPLGVIIADDKVTAGGVDFTWKASPSGVVQAQLVTSTTDPNNTVVGENLFNMAAKLNASVNGAVTPATYSTNATEGHKNATRLIATHDTPGFAGNAFTFAGAFEDDFDTEYGGTLGGGSDADVGVKEALVNLTQTTTADPTGTIIKNELGGALPTYARTSAGLYTITKTGAFPAAKFHPTSGVFHDTATKVVSWSLERTSDDVVTLRVKEVTYTTSNNVVLADKEISAMNTPLIPIRLLVKN